jgi:predicted transcriptional regulator of viral defense system
VLADLAESQWGLLTTAQAADLGITRLEMSRLVQRGFLERLAQGVFRTRGSSTEWLGLKAAWLRLSPKGQLAQRWRSRDAVVSHESAAALQGLGEFLGDVHEFTCPVRHRPRDPNIRIHVALLAEGEVRIVDGLPVTAPLRTVQDLLAAGGDGGHVGGVLVDGLNQGLIEHDAVPAAIARHARRYGASDGEQLLELLIVSSTPALLVPTPPR